MLDLVSFSVNGVRASKAGKGFRAVGAFFKSDEQLVIETKEEAAPVRLTPAELTPLFRSMTPAAQSQHFGVRSFMAEDAEFHLARFRAYDVPDMTGEEWLPSDLAMTA